MKKLILLLCLLCPYLSSYGAVYQFSLNVGESEFLELPDAPMDGYINQASWGCDNENITVDGSIAGAIIKINHYFTGTAIVEGWYQYAYLYNGKLQVGDSIAYYRITCNGKSVSISETSITLNAGETHKLKLSGSNSRYTPIWSTYNSQVAQVSPDGLVTAISSGSTTIACDPIIGPPVYCEVTVKVVSPQSIEIDPDKITLAEGNTYSLKAVFSPTGASSKLAWSSENTTIATVNSNGIVTAKKVGTTKISVLTENELSAKCEVTVVPAPTAVQLPENFEILEGFGKKLTPTLTPSNSTTTYKWSSSDTSVATVSLDGTVTGKAAGAADITVTTANNKSAVCHITVKPTPENISKTIIDTKINRIKKLINNTKKQY